MLKAHPIATPDKNVQQIHGNEHGRKLSDRACRRGHRCVLGEAFMKQSPQMRRTTPGHLNGMT